MRHAMPLHELLRLLLLLGKCLEELFYLGLAGRQVVTTPAIVFGAEFRWLHIGRYAPSAGHGVVTGTGCAPGLLHPDINDVGHTKLYIHAHRYCV